MQNTRGFQNVPFLLQPELMENKTKDWVHESPSVVPQRPGLTLANLQQWPQSAK